MPALKGFKMISGEKKKGKLGAIKPKPMKVPPPQSAPMPPSPQGPPVLKKVAGELLLKIGISKGLINRSMWKAIGKGNNAIFDATHAATPELKRALMRKGGLFHAQAGRFERALEKRKKMEVSGTWLDPSSY